MESDYRDFGGKVIVYLPVCWCVCIFLGRGQLL